MNELVIEKQENRPQLTARVNGVQIPLISKIDIESACGEYIRVHITCIVAKTPNGQVVIKSYNE